MAESTNKKTGDNQKKTDDMQSKQQIIKGLLETAKKNGKIASKELNLAIDERELTTNSRISCLKCWNRWALRSRWRKRTTRWPKCR